MRQTTHIFLLIIYFLTSVPKAIWKDKVPVYIRTRQIAFQAFIEHTQLF